MLLSLIVPCFNEAGNVEPLYEKVCETFLNRIEDFEFVFVNDGSKDETAARLRGICSRSDHIVKVIDFTRNFGKEAAIYAGLQHADGDLITIMDADLQQDPSYVVKMADYLKENPGCDCVTAFQKVRHEGFVRRRCKKHFYRLMNRLSDTEFVDGASDFRTFRASVKDAVLEMSEYHRFSKGIFSWVGFNTCYLPYEANERLSGTTKWSFGKLCKYAFEGIVAFTTVPLKISTWVGCLTSLGALLYIIAVLVEKLAFGIAVPGYATTVILILFLGGLQLLALGINGEYLSRTYIQAKHRPVYLAREVITNKKNS